MRTAAALALCTLALAACGTNPAGSASVVGAQSVRDADVAADVDEVRQQVEGIPGQPAFDQAAVTAKTVQRKTRHLLLDEARAAQGITIAQAKVDEIIATAVTGQFGGDRAKFDAALAAQESVPASGVEEYARDFLIQQALPATLAPGKTQDEQAKALNAYIAKLSDERGVRIAARFGTWDPSTGALGPVPNDLSVPARALGAPSPSASPTS
jgi:hypothetical protein